MIIKNGEILAIDHIAHDNTLSGNGTSAKPVGLSQSTKDLIDSKVKKTDFETYKSSAANQISNINTKITTDESNFELYKSSAHNEIARVDASIAAVNAAKVDKTTFTQYQTDVANSFTAVNKRIDDVDAAKVDNTTFDNFKGSANGELTGIKQSITDLDNAKQAKGDYVSASNFNSYKSSAHNEIARVDGRIDATNTNLSNNYYDRTTIDRKFADFGGYKFREPDPNNNNQPILNDGEEPDPKAIYLTQPEGATQYLQWIWDEEITEENKWKCIGDTTVDLKDYAKTVDVVASAEANKDWAERTFETQTEFSAVIEGYYTKGEVDTKLATKVDNTYKTEVEQDFVDTSAWANATFATKTDLYNDKSELEGEINNLESKIEQDINNASADIINKIDTTSAYLDDKIEAVIDTLEDDYYTSEQIDTILAASGSYYTQSQVDEKLEEYAKSTELNPIKDDINSISAEFDALDRFVDAIDNDLDTVSANVDMLSGKVNRLHNTVIESSNTVIATPTTGEDGTVTYELSANSNELWKPTVNADGDISWERSESTIAPTTVNIKGPKGDDGKTPEFRINPESNYWEYKFNDTSWIPLDISATGPQGPAGIDGTNGQDGKDGISLSATSTELDQQRKTQVQIGQVNGPVQTTFDLLWGQNGVSPTVVTGDAVTSEEHENGGTTITITDAAGSQTFTAWNGNDGTMAGAPNIEGKNGISAVLAGSTYEVGLSGAFYNAITSVSSTYATKDALNDYLTKDDAVETYQPKGEYLVADDIAGKADKTDLQYVSAGVDYISGQIPTKVTDLTDSADYAKKTDLAGFVTSGDITTQDTNYVMTTTGWKVLTLPGGGMTQVIHDATLTGQGNDDNSKLGVAWSALSAYTITSALSAGSATVAANLGTSSFADITGAINAKADATAISDMLTKTVASQTYQTIAGMSDYLTTAQYETDSAKYVVTGDILTAASNKLTGIKVDNTDYTIQETDWTNTIQDASAKAFNDATANANELYVTKASAHNEFVNTSSWANTAFQPKGNYVATADLLTAASNKLTGIKVGNTNYEIPLFNGVTADNNTITGDGNTNPLGVAWSALSGNTITSALSAGSATSAYSAYSASYATTAASAYIDSNTTSAMSDIVDELHGKLDSTVAAQTYQTIDDMSAYLPLTGGTVTGQTTISGSAFDIFELKRSDQQGSTGIIGINGAGGMSFKIVNGNNNTQLNIAPNATMDKRFSIGDTPHQPAAYFIPAVTATTTDGLTDDGILHIIVEN